MQKRIEVEVVVEMSWPARGDSCVRGSPPQWSFATLRQLDAHSRQPHKAMQHHTSIDSTPEKFEDDAMTSGFLLAQLRKEYMASTSRYFLLDSAFPKVPIAEGWPNHAHQSLTEGRGWLAVTDGIIDIMATRL